ncbi:Condensin complex subunit 3 [Brachionus plicatilis]|uniref:Condensin complex subunit 3 n=1 Tax=Brachionus plicatilis TaxID=10195 RepID=A0A3M7SZX2_BRAPC|nr:Condensin complex subunit 3 [Brachionus plicatilis]
MVFDERLFKRIAIQPMLIVMQKNANVDRCVEFIAKFCASLSPVREPQDSQMDLEHTQSEVSNNFLISLINYLIDHNRANYDATRYRVCHILSRLMSVISNDQSIDEDLFDRLCDAMLERLKDINSRVQVQAISAIYRLQDPTDRDCRVIKALLFLMTYDLHWQVRFQALSNIAFSKQTLPEIIDRVKDPHPQVRRKAILILSEKVLIKFISIEKRLLILRYALKDQDESVVDACSKKLIPSWLAFKENDVCKLLKALDVVNSHNTCQLMLDKMFAENSLESLCQEFSHNLNEKTSKNELLQKY